MRMSPTGRLILLGVAFAALAQTGHAQKAGSWRVYRAADGLAQTRCDSVTTSPHGRLMVTHASGRPFSELDGYEIKNLLSPPAPGRVYQSPAGQFWSVAPGALEEFKDAAWTNHPVPAIAGEFARAGSGPAPSVPLCPSRQGVVLFLLPDALMVFNSEDPAHPHTESLRRAADTQLGKFTGMTASRDGGLWILGTRGVAALPGPVRNLKPDTVWTEHLPPAGFAWQNFRNPQPDGQAGLTALAESASGAEWAWIHFDGDDWTAHTLPNEKVRLAWQGPDGSPWAASSESLYTFDAVRGEWMETDEVSAREYLDVAVGLDGLFWLATSDGLFRCGLPSWRTPEVARKVTAAIHGFAEGSDGCVWLVTGNVLCAMRSDGAQEYPIPRTAAGFQSSRGLYRLKDASLLLDTGGAPIQFRPSTGAFSSVGQESSSQRMRPLGYAQPGELCLAAADKSGQNGGERLTVFDGGAFKEFPFPLPGDAAAASFSIVFAEQTGDLWLGGAEGVWWRHQGKWTSFSAADRATPQAAQFFAEAMDGTIWCATADQVWEFDGKSWLLVRAAFDRINGLACARDGSVWVASNSGLHRFYRGTWVENGAEEGLPATAVRAVFEDREGRVWAGTARGVAVFHPEADTEPPRAMVQGPTGDGADVPEGGAITLTFGAHDRWDATPPGRLLYSYRLDDREWSSFADVNGVSFADLPSGKHVFQVRALDRSCNLSEPARFEFAVALPWYRESRLVLTSAAGLALVILFAGIAFNRHRQLRRSYALVEKKVAERTRDLERAHQELLHSQKMTALGTLSAGIAHDFNNILSIIKGSAQIIEDNPGNPEKIRTRVDRIKTVVEQGSGIVKAMLGFSRGPDQQTGPCNLTAVLDDTVKLLGDRFLREVEVHVENSGELPELTVPRDFIQQILLNFIFNAAEARGTSKQVLLAAAVLGEPPAGCVLAPARADSYIAVSVQDFGCGIPPEIMPRIFEPFFTTKAMSTRRGTGLGLSMAYELARKMDAGIAVRSAVGHGSTFTLVLPVRTAPKRVDSAAARPQPIPEPHRESRL